MGHTFIFVAQVSDLQRFNPDEEKKTVQSVHTGRVIAPEMLNDKKLGRAMRCTWLQRRSFYSKLNRGKQISILHVVYHSVDTTKSSRYRGYVRVGAKNMKSMQLPSVAIDNLFLQWQGGVRWPCPHTPRGSATDELKEIYQTYHKKNR